MLTRAIVQSKAREFIDTPFKPQHRMKGPRGGVDCVGIILLVAEELGVCYNDTQAMRGQDYIQYGMDQIGSIVLPECKKRLIEKHVKDIKPGDIVVMRVPDIPCHCAIITEQHGQLYMIHAYNSGPEKVVEHILDAKWRRRIVGAFTYPGLQD